MIPWSVQSGGISWARVGRSRLWSKVGFACVILKSLATSLMTLDSPGHGPFWTAVVFAFGLASLTTAVSFVLSYAIWFTRTPKPGTLGITPAGVAVEQGGRTSTIDRARVKSAYLVRRPVGGGEVATAEIVLDDGDVISVRTANENAAAAIVAALGFSPGGSRVALALASPTRRLLHLLFGVVAYFASTFAVTLPLALLSPVRVLFVGELFSCAVMFGVYALLKHLTRPAVVTVGEDGFVFASGSKTRFVPRSAIHAVQHDTGEVPCVRTGEGDLVLGEMGVDPACARAAARLVHERLVSRIGVPDGKGILFERAGRSVPEWRETLRRSFEDGSYRAAGASVDDAAAVLGSATSSPEQRVGAALALRVAGAPPERTRVAADAIADVDLREALEAVAESDDARVEKAVSRLSRRR